MVNLFYTADRAGHFLLKLPIMNTKLRLFSASLLLSLCCASAASAQDFYMLVGKDNDTQAHSSYAWQLSYQQKLIPYIDWSFSWINEGHYPTSHRDGPALQLLAHTELLDKHLSLYAGYGAYRYFDTETSKHSTSFKDAHGWGGVGTLAATWRFNSGFLLQARLNHIMTDKKLETTSLQMGLGYQLDKGGRAAKPLSGPDYDELKNEITAYVGKTIVNSATSQSAHSMGLEYRRELCKYLDGTAGYLYEGNPDIVRRGGLTAQIWPKQEFFGGRLSLGVGFGAYAAVDNRRKDKDAGGNMFLSGLLTMGVSYRITPHVALRANWNRTITNYNRDTDVMVGGVGYRF